MRFNRSDKDQNSKDATSLTIRPSERRFGDLLLPYSHGSQPSLSHVVLARMYSQFISRMMRLHSTPSVKIETERLTVKGLLERVWASL